MRNFRVILFTIILFSCLPAHPLLAGTPDSLFKAGKGAFEQNYFQSAAKSLTTLVEDYPDDPRADQAAYLLALSRFYLKDYAAALTILQRFAREYPLSGLNSKTGYWLGAVYYNQQQYSQALVFLDQQLQDPGQAYRIQALYLKGLALQKTGSHEEARDTLLLLAAEPSQSAGTQFQANVLYQLGSVEFLLANYTQALDDFKKLLLNYPDSSLSADTAFFMAECEYQLAKGAEAIRRYRSVLELYPGSAYRETCLFRLAELTYTAADYQQSLAYLQQLEEESPRSRYAENLPGIKAPVLFKLNRFAEAIPWYTRLLKQAAEEEKQALYYNLGLAGQNTGQFREAAGWFENAARGRNQQIMENSLLKLSEVYLELGDFTHAIAILEQYKTRYPSSRGLEEVLRAQALSYMKNQDTTQAINLWSTLLKQYTHSLYRDEYLFRRGLCRITAGSFKEALFDLQQILQLFPASSFYAEACYNIGYVYSLRNEYVRSFEYFEQVLQLAPGKELEERTLLAMGINHYNLGQFRESTEILERLIPGSRDGRWQGMAGFYLGKTYLRAGQLEKAGAGFARAALAMQGTAEGAEALYWQGWTEFRLNRLAASRDTFLAVTEQYPAYVKYGECFFRAGLCEALLKNWQQSNVLLNLALETAAAQGQTQLRQDLLYRKAMNFLEMGETRLAEAGFLLLKQNFPGSELAAGGFMLLADAAYAAQNWQQAQQGYAALLRDFPESANRQQALFMAGSSLAELGRYAEAVDSLLAYLTAYPGGQWVEDAFVVIRKVFQQTGSAQAVSEFYTRCTANNGLSLLLQSRIKYEYACWLFPQEPGRAYAILEELQRAHVAEPLLSSVNLLAGDYYLLRNDPARAYLIYKGIAEAGSSRVAAEAAVKSGDALAGQGRLAEAFDEYLNLTFVFPDFKAQVKEALRKAASLAVQLGREQQAARLQQRLTEEFPDGQ